MAEMVLSFTSEETPSGSARSAAARMGGEDSTWAEVARNWSPPSGGMFPILAWPLSAAGQSATGPALPALDARQLEATSCESRSQSCSCMADLCVQVGERVVLRPYTRALVPKYHEWMKDEWLQG
jgi:hypothetical protein